jgi:hypothetical protein
VPVLCGSDNTSAKETAKSLDRVSSPISPATASQSLEDRHQQRHTECWDSSRDEQLPRAKSKRKQRATKKRSQDAAYTSHSERPTCAGGANRRRISNPRERIDSGLAAAADSGAADQDRKQPKRRIEQSYSKHAQSTEGQPPSQNTLHSDAVDDRRYEHWTRNDAHRVHCRTQNRSGGAHSRAVQDGRCPQQDEINAKQTEQIDCPKQQGLVSEAEFERPPRF